MWEVQNTSSTQNKVRSLAKRRGDTTAKAVTAAAARGRGGGRHIFKFILRLHQVVEQKWVRVRVRVRLGLGLTIEKGGASRRGEATPRRRQ